MSSNRQWGYYSYAYAAKHLYPVNPLHFADHPATTNVKSTVHQLASSFLLFAATRTARKSQLESLIPHALAGPKVNALAKDKKKYTFSILAKLVSGSDDIPMSTKTVFEALAFLSNQANKSNTHNNLVPVMKQVGPLCIKVLDNGLSNKLKAVNSAAVKKFKSDFLQ